MMTSLSVSGFVLVLLQHSAPVPVVSRIYVQPFVCNLAAVRGLRRGRYLLVRTGPGIRHSQADRLSNGDTIYTCNESRDWIGIVFARPGSPCSAPAGRGLDIRRAHSCRSGWVHRDWVTIITG